MYPRISLKVSLWVAFIMILSVGEGLMWVFNFFEEGGSGIPSLLCSSFVGAKNIPGLRYLTASECNEAHEL